MYVSFEFAWPFATDLFLNLVLGKERPTFPVVLCLQFRVSIRLYHFQSPCTVRALLLDPLLKALPYMHYPTD